MSVLWTDTDAARATGGECQGKAWRATGVSIDSRAVVPGDLFVALQDQRDGHDFVAKALESGAVAALVRRRPRDVPDDAPLLTVPDTLKGLEGLAAAARARTKARVIAITGSVGKTGTKEMMRKMLAGQGRVHAAERSFNNHWGVPLTLARMPQDTEFAVLEIGMNHAGEITPLSQLAVPHVAVITTVALAHAAAFSGVRAIAEAKSEIFAGLAPGAIAVLNRDIDTYPFLLGRARRAKLQPIRFGATGRPEFRLLDIRIGERATTVQVSLRGVPMMFRIAASGRHLAMNAMAALAGVEALGADVTRAALSLASWSAPDGRGARLVLDLGESGIDGQVRVIDESYNANPTSMGAALEVLAASKPADGFGRVQTGRRIAFLGDMLELGPDEAALHAGLAAHPAMRDISRVHCVGPRMRALHAALPPGKQGEWFETSEGLAARAGRLVDAGDVVMVKGSLGARMARVLDAFRLLGAMNPEHVTEMTAEDA